MEEKDLFRGITENYTVCFLDGCPKADTQWLFRLFASFSFKRLRRQMKLVKFLVKYKSGGYDVREMRDE